jgi:hypothetical protein
MREPRHLTTLWAFTACYRDSFTFTLRHHILTVRNSERIYTHSEWISRKYLSDYTLIFRGWTTACNTFWKTLEKYILDFFGELQQGNYSMQHFLKDTVEIHFRFLWGTTDLNTKLKKILNKGNITHITDLGSLTLHSKQGITLNQRTPKRVPLYIQISVNWRTPWSWVLENLPVSQMLKNLSFHRSWRFITVFTRALSNLL